MANNGKRGKVELHAISLLLTLPFTESLEHAMDVMTVLLGNLAPDGINFPGLDTSDRCNLSWISS